MKKGYKIKSIFALSAEQTPELRYGDVITIKQNGSCYLNKEGEPQLFMIVPLAYNLSKKVATHWDRIILMKEKSMAKGEL